MSVCVWERLLVYQQTTILQSNSKNMWSKPRFRIPCSKHRPSPSCTRRSCCKGTVQANTKHHLHIYWALICDMFLVMRAYWKGNPAIRKVFVLILLLYCLLSFLPSLIHWIILSFKSKIDLSATATMLVLPPPLHCDLENWVSCISFIYCLGCHSYVQHKVLLWSY